jgi:predicted O-methyltransferase YrrM
MDKDWIESLLSVPELRKMGHGQSAADANLGLGWLYYAEVRMQRPQLAVCIGSWRGYVPLVLAKGLQDNGNGGRLVFIDPGLVDNFWADATRVQAWFARFGVHNIEHHRQTTQQFVQSAAWQTLGEVGLLFVDGMHTAAQARFDHEAFAPLLAAQAPVFFHDGVRRMMSGIYGQDQAYEHTVVDYVEQLRQRPDLQVMEYALDSGVALVRQVLPATARVPIPKAVKPQPISAT